MVNERDYVKDLFNKALSDDESELEVYEESENKFGYYDVNNDYERSYYYNETSETLANRILMDDEVSEFLDKDALADFLIKRLDPNSLMVLEKMAFVFDSGDDYDSKSRIAMHDEYLDEYALFASDDALGLTWVERQIVFVNVSELVKSSIDIANDPDETYSAEYIFSEGLLQTIFHECRHLLYECNELVEIGEGTPYPQRGGMEMYVEEYGNDMAEEHIGEFCKDCIKPNLCDYLSKMASVLDVEIEEKDDEYY